MYSPCSSNFHGHFIADDQKATQGGIVLVLFPVFRGKIVPVGDICKCATVNIYEPLYPVVELITISKGTGIAFNSWSIGPAEVHI